jgi:signal transduction histidine kinase
VKLIRARSLQAQMALRLAALYVAATLIGVAVLVFQAYSTAETLSEEDLTRRADDLAGYVTADARLDLPTKLQAAYGSPAQTFLFAIRGPTGQLIAASHPEIRGAAANWPLAEDDPRYFRLEDFGSTGQDYYGLTARLDSKAGPLSVTVARATDATELVHAVLWEFVLDIAWVIPLVMAATLLIGVFGIRRGLEPLRQTSLKAAAIDAGSLSVRLPEEDLPSEIRPLVNAVNGALDRLERGFAMQRQFTANAAHEIRTPMAIVTAGLEQMGRGEEVAKLRADVARVNRLVEQLLSVARLDAMALDVTGTVDLSAVATTVVEYMAPLALHQGRQLAVQGADRVINVQGNRYAIEDAVRNLVENAITHAPPGTEIVVTVDAAGSVNVTDRGPGVPPEERVRIFERFWRGRTRAGAGAGLGLAIVEEIMKAHRGTARVAEASGGGASFTLVFPAAPPR